MACIIDSSSQSVDRLHLMAHKLAYLWSSHDLHDLLAVLEIWQASPNNEHKAYRNHALCASHFAVLKDPGKGLGRCTFTCCVMLQDTPELHCQTSP